MSGTSADGIGLCSLSDGSCGRDESPVQASLHPEHIRSPSVDRLPRSSPENALGAARCLDAGLLNPSVNGSHVDSNEQYCHKGALIVPLSSDAGNPYT